MIAKEVKKLEFGLSILHGWIRFYECLLHVAYKLPIKKWQARTDFEKFVVAENKSRIQTEFRKKLDLLFTNLSPASAIQMMATQHEDFLKTLKSQQILRN